MAISGDVYQLSPYDQLLIRWHIPLHLFYQTSEGVKYIDILRSSLFGILRDVYPMLLCELVPDPNSGDERFQERTAPNDTEIFNTLDWPDLSFSTFEQSNFSSNVIPKEFSPQIQMTTPFGVRVNLLQEGLVISLGLNHIVSDAGGFGGLIQTWMRKARGLEVSLDPCIHDRSFFFQKLDELEPGFTEAQSGTGATQTLSSVLPETKARMFNFSKERLSELRSRCDRVRTSAPDVYPESRLSSNDLLGALLWTRVVRARRSINPEVVVQGSLTLPLDGRHRLQPPLPPLFFGNANTLVRANLGPSILLADDEDRALTDAAYAVRKTVNAADHAFIRNFLLSPDSTKILEAAVDADICLTSWSRMFPDGSSGSDFGIGPADKIRGPPAIYDGFCHVFPPMKDGSIDVQVVLAPSTMEILAPDPLWNTYAT